MPNYSWLMFIQTMSFFFCDNRHDSPWQAENEELIQRFRLGMGSSCGFQSLLAMLAEHSLWGALRSLKCRNIFVSLWKLIEEKGWSAVFASLNHFDHRIDILDWSASTCLCPHDLMMYPSDCLIFPSLRVSRLSHVCVSPWLRFLIPCFCSHVSMLAIVMVAQS